MSNNTHTAQFADGTQYTFDCSPAKRISWALAEAAKRQTKVLSFI